MDQDDTMGSNCSMQRPASSSSSRNSTSPRGRGGGYEKWPRGGHRDDGAGLNVNLHSSLRHSVLLALPDISIGALYPVEDNYVLDEHGDDDETDASSSWQRHVTRSPKTLATLATEALCRHLVHLDGALPPGLPPDVVDTIVDSLVAHAALNAKTLSCLQHCELSSLSLSKCRGVSDAWLVPLSSQDTVMGPNHLAPHGRYQHYRPHLGLVTERVESMDLDDMDRHEHYRDLIMRSPSNDSTASFVSAMSSDPQYTKERLYLPCMSHEMEEEEEVEEEDTKLSPRNVPPQRSLSPPLMFRHRSSSSITSNLTLLDLSGSQRVTDNGLLHLHDLGALQTVKLDHCHLLTGRGLLALANSHKLSSVSLAHCRRLTDEAVANMAHLLSLECLNLAGCRCLTDGTLQACADLYNLQCLDLQACDLITNDGLKHLKSLERLQDLSLGWCRLISDDGVATLAAQPGRAAHLQALCLSRCPISDTCLTHLAKLQSLQDLNLSGCGTHNNSPTASRLTSAALGAALAQLPALTQLDVSHCPGIIKSGWQGKTANLRTLDLCYASVRDSHISKLSSLPNLVELNLDSCLVGDWAIAHLADNGVTPNLEVLDLADTDVGDAGLLHVAKFAKLRRLSLFYCNISNHGLRHLSQLTSLQVLNLDSRDISDDGLKHLRSLPLTSLDVFSGRVTDVGCGHVSKIKTLESLELCGGGIGDLGCTLLATLDKLQVLNLSQNDRITNRGAAALAALSNLRSLNLSNTRVNAAALRFFGDLRNLQTLALYGCRGVDADVASVERLQQGLPNLKCLRLNSTADEDGMVTDAALAAAAANAIGGADDERTFGMEDDDDDDHFEELPAFAQPPASTNDVVEEAENEDDEEDMYYSDHD